MHLLFHLVAAACLVTTAAVAQQPKPEKPKTLSKKSAPAPFERQAETAAAGQKFLAKFQGEWKVSKTVYPTEGQPVVTKGFCSQFLIHKGRFLQSNFKFLEGRETSTGMGLIGFEPETGLFTSIWTDARQARMSIQQSKDQFDGQKIILYSKALDGQTPQTQRYKTESHLEENASKIIHRQYSITPTGEERLVVLLVLARTR